MGGGGGGVGGVCGGVWWGGGWGWGGVRQEVDGIERVGVWVSKEKGGGQAGVRVHTRTVSACTCRRGPRRTPLPARHKQVGTHAVIHALTHARTPSRLPTSNAVTHLPVAADQMRTDLREEEEEEGGEGGGGRGLHACLLKEVKGGRARGAGQR